MFSGEKISIVKGIQSVGKGALLYKVVRGLSHEVTIEESI